MDGINLGRAVRIGRSDQAPPRCRRRREPAGIHGRRLGRDAAATRDSRAAAWAVRLLLDRGADPKRAGAGSLTPLVLAAGDTDPTSSNCCSPTERTRPSRTKRSHTTVSRGLRRHIPRTRPPDVRRLPRRNGAHARSRTIPRLRLKRNSARNDAIWWARIQRCEDVLRLIDE